MVNILFVAAGLAVAVSSTDLPSHHKIGGFSAHQVRSPNYVSHGPSQYLRTLLKYGGTPSAHLLSAVESFRNERRAMLARRAVSGSAPTAPEPYDVEYLTNISIGTPPQVLSMDFDSGSSDLWVMSSETPANNRTGHSIYTPTDSSTMSNMTGSTWSIGYGDGSWSAGIVYKDVVTIGGVSVKDQAVESALKVSSSFTADTNNDGLLGLGFSSINTVKPQQQKTFFDNIVDSLESPLWTADLKHNASGTYNFGFIDSSAYTGEISYAQVDSSGGFWSFEVTRFTFGDTTIPSSAAMTTTSAASASSSSLGSETRTGGGSSSITSDTSFSSSIASRTCTEEAEATGTSTGTSKSPKGGDHDHDHGWAGGFYPRERRHGARPSGSGNHGAKSQAASVDMTVIGDTGTTLMLLDPQIVDVYWSKVQGAQYNTQVGGFVFPCNAKLLDFGYTVANTTITVPSAYMNFAHVDDTACFGSLQRNTGMGAQILGDVALKAAFVVHKVENSTPTIGFATKNL